MFGCYTRNKVDNEMPNLTLENIANACEGTYVGDPSKKQKIITGAVTDSRKVEEGFLFIPIKGERDRKSTRLNSSHPLSSRMPSSA